MGRSPSRPGASSQRGSVRQAACSICKGRARQSGEGPFRFKPSELYGQEPVGRNHTRVVQTAHSGQDASISGEIPHPRGEKAQIFCWERCETRGCVDGEHARCRDPDPVSPQGLQSRFDADSAPSLHVLHEGVGKLAGSASTCKGRDGREEGLDLDPDRPIHRPRASWEYFPAQTGVGRRRRSGPAARGVREHTASSAWAGTAFVRFERT